MSLDLSGINQYHEGGYFRVEEGKRLVYTDDKNLASSWKEVGALFTEFSDELSDLLDSNKLDRSKLAAVVKRLPPSNVTDLLSKTLLWGVPGDHRQTMQTLLSLLEDYPNADDRVILLSLFKGVQDVRVRALIANILSSAEDPVALVSKIKIDPGDDGYKIVSKLLTAKFPKILYRFTLEELLREHTKDHFGLVYHFINGLPDNQEQLLVLKNLKNPEIRLKVWEFIDAQKGPFHDQIDIFIHSSLLSYSIKGDVLLPLIEKQPEIYYPMLLTMPELIPGIMNRLSLPEYQLKLFIAKAPVALRKDLVYVLELYHEVMGEWFTKEQLDVYNFNEERLQEIKKILGHLKSIKHNIKDIESIETLFTSLFLIPTDKLDAMFTLAAPLFSNYRVDTALMSVALSSPGDTLKEIADQVLASTKDIPILYQSILNSFAQLLSHNVDSPFTNVKNYAQCFSGVKALWNFLPNRAVKIELLKLMVSLPLNEAGPNEMVTDLRNHALQQDMNSPLSQAFINHELKTLYEANISKARELLMLPTTEAKQAAKHNFGLAYLINKISILKNQLNNNPLVDSVKNLDREWASLFSQLEAIPDIPDDLLDCLTFEILKNPRSLPPGHNEYVDESTLNNEGYYKKESRNGIEGRITPYGHVWYPLSDFKRPPQDYLDRLKKYQL